MEHKITSQELSIKSRLKYKEEERKDWIKRNLKLNNKEPSDRDIAIFNYGFDRGYKSNRKRIIELLGGKLITNDALEEDAPKEEGE